MFLVSEWWMMGWMLMESFVTDFPETRKTLWLVLAKSFEMGRSRMWRRDSRCTGTLRAAKQQLQTLWFWGRNWDWLVSSRSPGVLREAAAHYMLIPINPPAIKSAVHLLKTVRNEEFPETLRVKWYLEKATSAVSHSPFTVQSDTSVYFGSTHF